MRKKEKVIMFLIILMLITIHIIFLVNLGMIPTQVLTVIENIFGFIFKIIMVSFLIISVGLAIFLFGSIMCDVCKMIKQSWLCMIFVERAITKRSLKRLKRSNLVLFLLGEYLSDYKFDTRKELDREVKKYKYLISDGISETIIDIVVSTVFFWWSNKEERAILRKVLKENKEKLDRVDFEKVKKVIQKLDYSSINRQEEYTTIGRDYRYNDENYYEYFSKNPVLPARAIFDDFDFYKCRMLNEIIEVVDNPEEEFPLYIDSSETIREYREYIKR